MVRARDRSRQAIGSALAEGSLVRVARGLYMNPKASTSEHHSLVEVAVAVPRGVVCLLSALRFRGIGTQSPHEMWLAIDVKAWKTSRRR